MKMSDKRKFVVAPKSREIGPHVVGVKICVVAPKSREIGPHVGRQNLCDQKLASDSSGLSGGFRGIGRGFGL
jgi:hypothetical protein